MNLNLLHFFSIIVQCPLCLKSRGQAKTHNAVNATLSMDRHVSEVVRSCNFHTYALRHIRSSLNVNAAQMIAQGIVAARLNYCNSTLHGTSSANFDRLQVAQNTGESGMLCPVVVQRHRAASVAPLATCTSESRAQDGNLDLQDDAHKHRHTWRH